MFEGESLIVAEARYVPNTEPSTAPFRGEIGIQRAQQSLETGRIVLAKLES